MNFGFVIDNRKCIGCHACTVACKSEHEVPLGVNRTWVKYIEKGTFPQTRRLFSVMRCNHCDAAPCIEICPVTALFRRPDGIVDFDNRRCIGCKSCMQACPYDALYIDPETFTAAKCNYCAHRIDLGLEPACVNVCPEQAIISGDIDDPASAIARLLAREQVQIRKPEKGTRPKLFYVDGDVASLVPSLAAPAADYLQSSQTSGVGHFARFAAARGQGAGARMPAPPAPAGPPATASAPVLARRVHDAPAKGVLWGWEVTAYLWTKAIAAGVFFVPALVAALHLAPVPAAVQWVGWGTALVFLTFTAILLIKDLDRPDRFLYVLLRPQWKSWLVRGSCFLLLYGALLMVWAAAQVWKWPAGARVAAFAGASLALLVAVYTAFLFAQAQGRDFWQSPLLPLHMFLHALIAGAAAGVLLGGFAAETLSWQKVLRLALLLGLGANMLSLVAEIATLHATDDAKRAARMIAAGQHRMLFWGGSVLAGHLLPFALLLSDSGPALEVAAALSLAGVYITDHLWVRVPQLLPLA